MYTWIGPLPHVTCRCGIKVLAWEAFNEAIVCGIKVYVYMHGTRVKRTIGYVDYRLYSIYRLQAIACYIAS